VDHRQSIDRIYLMEGSWQAFTFYAPKFRLENATIIKGSGHQSADVERDLKGLQGEARVWLLMVHGKKLVSGMDNEAVVLQIADIHGKRISQFNGVGAAAYLYDFRTLVTKPS
jgi:hypothetical protein